MNRIIKLRIENPAKPLPFVVAKPSNPPQIPIDQVLGNTTLTQMPDFEEEFQAFKSHSLQPIGEPYSPQPAGIVDAGASTRDPQIIAAARDRWAAFEQKVRQRLPKEDYELVMALVKALRADANVNEYPSLRLKVLLMGKGEGKLLDELASMLPHDVQWKYRSERSEIKVVESLFKPKLIPSIYSAIAKDVGSWDEGWMALVNWDPEEK